MSTNVNKALSIVCLHEKCVSIDLLRKELEKQKQLTQYYQKGYDNLLKLTSRKSFFSCKCIGVDCYNDNYGWFTDPLTYGTYYLKKFNRNSIEINYLCDECQGYELNHLSELTFKHSFSYFITMESSINIYTFIRDLCKTYLSKKENRKFRVHFMNGKKIMYDESDFNKILIQNVASLIIQTAFKYKFNTRYFEHMNTQESTIEYDEMVYTFTDEYFQIKSPAMRPDMVYVMKNNKCCNVNDYPIINRKKYKTHMWLTKHYRYVLNTISSIIDFNNLARIEFTKDDDLKKNLAAIVLQLAFKFKFKINND